MLALTPPPAPLDMVALSSPAKVRVPFAPDAASVSVRFRAKDLSVKWSGVAGVAEVFRPNWVPPMCIDPVPVPG